MVRTRRKSRFSDGNSSCYLDFLPWHGWVVLPPQAREVPRGISAQGHAGPSARCPQGAHAGGGVFAPRFATRGCTDVTRWRVGALRAPGQRTVPAVLRGLGQSAEAPCHHDPRVRPRAPGSSLAARRRRLGRLLDVGAPAGPGVLGLAASRERRRGERLLATRIDRAPGRSSPAPFVKASG